MKITPNQFVLSFFGLLVFLFIGSLTKAQSFTISSYAGNGVSGYFGDGGQATAAEFNPVFGIAIDTAGNIFIADEFNDRIRKITTSGIISTYAGNGVPSYNGDGGLATAAELYDPNGVGIDYSGNLYITDDWNQVVRKVDKSTGIITTIAGNGFGKSSHNGGYSGDGGLATLAELNDPSGVVIDKPGNIYITDWNSNRVRKVNTSGIISTVAGNGSAGFSGDGGAATVAELYNPWGVTLDPSGNIIIADWSNNRIRMVNSSGVITTLAGNGTPSFSGDGFAATAAELNTPSGVITDKFGNLFITDDLNSRVRMVNTSGIISTIAGNGVAGFSGDGGPAIAAEMNYPNGICVNRRTGDLFVSDQDDYHLRKLYNLDAGINNLQQSSNKIEVYPNPSNGLFTVKINTLETEDVSTIEIFTITGEKIFTKAIQPKLSENIVDMSLQANGIYFYRVVTSNGNLIGEGKLVIVK